jgi:hypothetical protein
VALNLGGPRPIHRVFRPGVGSHPRLPGAVGVSLFRRAVLLCSIEAEVHPAAAVTFLGGASLASAAVGWRVLSVRPVYLDFPGRATRVVGSARSLAAPAEHLSGA